MVVDCDANGGGCVGVRESSCALTAASAPTVDCEGGGGVGEARGSCFAIAPTAAFVGGAVETAVLVLVVVVATVEVAIG